MHLVYLPLGGVLIADRGFARASLFRWLQGGRSSVFFALTLRYSISRDATGVSQLVAIALLVSRGGRYGGGMSLTSTASAAGYSPPALLSRHRELAASWLGSAPDH